MVLLTTRVPPEYVDRIDHLAEKMGLDRSEMVRRLLANAMETMEQVTAIAENPIAATFLKLVTVLESDVEQRQEVVRVLRSIGNHKKKSKARKGKEATA